uniref:Putative secreted protein n=1 Tax=Anopheles marajoara TaxID=58244 RepID=A0A2M4C726_9DIPT
MRACVCVCRGCWFIAALLFRWCTPSRAPSSSRVLRWEVPSLLGPRGLSRCCCCCKSGRREPGNAVPADHTTGIGVKRTKDKQASAQPTGTNGPVGRTTTVQMKQIRTLATRVEAQPRLRPPSAPFSPKTDR